MESGIMTLMVVTTLHSDLHINALVRIKTSKLSRSLSLEEVVDT